MICVPVTLEPVYPGCKQICPDCGRIITGAAGRGRIAPVEPHTHRLTRITNA